MEDRALSAIDLPLSDRWSFHGAKSKRSPGGLPTEDRRRCRRKTNVGPTLECLLGRRSQIVLLLHKFEILDNMYLGGCESRLKSPKAENAAIKKLFKMAFSPYVMTGVGQRRRYRRRQSIIFF